MISQNLALLFQETALRYPTKKALFYKEGQKYTSMDWAEVQRRVETLASFFLEQGLKPGDRVAILSENRPEWLITDFAALSVGASTVPVYTTLSAPEIRYILSDSSCRWVAVSGKPLYEKLCAIQKDLPVLEGIIAFDSALLLPPRVRGLPRDFDAVPAWTSPWG